MSGGMRGDEIRAERVRHGWSQPQLAQLVGVSKSLISMWETGAQTPDDRQVEALLEAFLGERGEPDARPPGRPKSNGGITPTLDLKTLLPGLAEVDTAIPEIYRRQATAADGISNGHMAMTADVIRAERKRRKWSQKVLADRIGASRALVADWEISRRLPNEGFALKIQQVFDETPATADSDDRVAPRRRQARSDTTTPGRRSRAGNISAAEIKAERTLRGWSQQRLADIAGISRGLIGNWESGARGASPNLDQSQILRETFASNPVEAEPDVPRRSRRSTSGSDGEAVKDMPWKDAILRAMSDSGKPMHYAEIAQAIIDNGYRANVGATPPNAVSAVLSQSIRTLKARSPFIQEGDGVYSLRTKKKSAKSKESRDEAKESAAEMGLIRSFGILWDRDWVDWSYSVPRLLGVKQAGSQPVNFAEQAGIYVLYDQSRPIYVGQAGDKRLGARLKEHTRGRFSSRWNRFSWFGVRSVNSASGELEPAPTKQEISAATLITTMEALLIESLEPTQNRRGGDYNAVEYIQERDERIEDRQRTALLRELQMAVLNRV